MLYVLLFDTHREWNPRYTVIEVSTLAIVLPRQFKQKKLLSPVPLCIIDTGNCVPGKRENNDGPHTRGRNLIIYSCLYLYYVVKELYANL